MIRGKYFDGKKISLISALKYEDQFLLQSRKLQKMKNLMVLMNNAGIILCITRRMYL